MTDEYKLAPLPQVMQRGSSHKMQIISPMNFSEAMVHRAKKCATPDFNQSPIKTTHGQGGHDTQGINDFGNPQSPSVAESEISPPEMYLKNRESQKDSDFVDISALDE